MLRKRNRRLAAQFVPPGNAGEEGTADDRPGRMICRVSLISLLSGFCLLWGGSVFPVGGSAQERRQKSPTISPEKRLQLLKTFVKEFVDITPGRGPFPRTFRMGSENGPVSERPVHVVTMKHDFAMARYEVPQNLYEAVMGENPSRWQGPRNSAEMMSWSDAVQFCRRITLLLRKAKLIGATDIIRLPTEAEWEYCCRAGTHTAYSFGDKAAAPQDTGKKASLLDSYGWHTGNAAGNDPPVGALKPNAWGLYDMHGYLWEFTADDWHPSYQGAPATAVLWRNEKSHSRLKVIRGGSWRDHYERLRSAARLPLPDHAKSDAIGFRCVMVSLPH